MSNNLVSQPLSLPNKQMDPISDKLEVSNPNMRMGMMDSMSNSPTPQQVEISNKEVGLVAPMSKNFELPNSPVFNRQMGQMQMQVSNLGLQQFFMPHQQVGSMQAMLNSLGAEKFAFPSKRKAVGEPMFSNYGGQQLLMPNRNVSQMESVTNNPGLQQLSSPNKRTPQVHSKPGTPSSQNLPAPNKKMARNESISGRSGTKQIQTPKNRTIQTVPSPKVQTESFESVRSKMRESLASALALVTQQQDKGITEESTEESNSENEAGMTMQQPKGDSRRAGSAPTIADAADKVSGNPTENSQLKGSCSVDNVDNVQTTSQGILTSESIGVSAQSCKDNEQEVPYTTSMTREDVPFGDTLFVKDELLQGNGLTWVLDHDADLEETKDVQMSKKPKLLNEGVGGEVKEKAVPSPKILAFKIELELFKLFGGVNKKYKEKGRSLLFNLKDHNNPELRERVMSGDISPERLCSMTAEELASKELSEWRMAKAEELAQMVVLPDSDVDIRRLVRKTHKGEFQVEFEQDDGVSVDVSVGTSSLTRITSKTKDTESHPSAKAGEVVDKENVLGEKSSSVNQDPSCSLTIPSDGSDLMQGLMVDEFKDAEFLPPIVSLDEFMESLDSEPPFENLPVDGGKAILPSAKETSEDYEVAPSDLASKEPVNATPKDPDNIVVKHKDSDTTMESKESSTEPKPSPAAASKSDHVWEGVLQLCVSVVVTVAGVFRSGERTSTKDWSSSLEIKGRVRLDAFEKFLKDLPMSRSRAVMVVHFVLKEGSAENDHASLGEAVQSYISDERLGFAEPAPGAEIYFCPPHPKIVEMLGNLSKDHSEILNSIDNGLIGVVVWRRAHLTSTVSPNSSSHHKHSSKKQHNASSRRQHEKETALNVNLPSKRTLPVGAPPTGTCTTRLDDDDDIPPGFGPGAARDEDDLPEFNFTGASNTSLPKSSSNQIASRGSGMVSLHPTSLTSHRPVDQMRELVLKYGQTGNSVGGPRNVGLGIQPWNDDDDDDDDDIPEWQPQLPQHQQQQPPRHAMHNFEQPVPLHAVQFPPPAAVVAPSWQQQQQSGGRWVQPPGAPVVQQQPSSYGGGGQYYGAAPPSRSRGF